jgi:hypothetical protein
VRRALGPSASRETPRPSTVTYDLSQSSPLGRGACFLWNSYSSILSRLAEKTTSRKGATAANKKATVITPFASLHEDSSLGQLDNVSVRFGGRMRFAKIVFTAAGIWGVVVLTPLYSPMT